MGRTPDVSKTTWKEKMESPTCTEEIQPLPICKKGPTWIKPFPASIIKYPTCGAPTCKATADVNRRRAPPRTKKATPHHRVALTLAWNNGTFLLISSSSASWAPLCKHNFKISNSMSLSLAAVCSSLKDSS